MQQTYGVNIMRHRLDDPDMGQDEAEWLGALCAQLPQDARVRVADNPDSAWKHNEWFLRSIDHSLKALIYAIGRGKGQKPVPADTPSEIERKARSAETYEDNRSFVDSILGFAERKEPGEG